MPEILYPDSNSLIFNSDSDLLRYLHLFCISARRVIGFETYSLISFL